MSAVRIMQWPTPTLNDRQLQFASIALGINGSPYFPWVTEVSYDHTLEPGEGRGTSPYPMGTTLGEYKANGSITVQRIHRELFMDIVEAGTPGLMDKYFICTISYQDYGWEDVETDYFYARITGANHEMSHGNSVLLVKFPLYISLVVMNGHLPSRGIAV